MLDIVRLLVIGCPLWMFLVREPARFLHIVVVTGVQAGVAVVVLAPVPQRRLDTATQVIGFFVTGFVLGYLRTAAPEPEPASVAEPT
jgi:hypothetical protein